MLLGIYLGSTVYVIRKVFKFRNESKEKLIEEGYTFVDYNLTKEDILHLFIAIGYILCPFINLSIPYNMAKAGDNGYTLYKKELIRSGQIVKEDEKISSKINSDYVLKQDEEMMKYNLTPEEVDFIKELRKAKSKKEAIENARIELFGNYPIMEQQFESDTSLDKGNSYKKTL